MTTPDGASGATTEDAADPGLLDDIRQDVSLGLEEVNELLGELIEMHGDRQRRGAEILGYRLGVSGEPPQTLAQIAARYDVSRDRVRQLHTRAVGRVLREAQLSGHRVAGVFAERYPLGARDTELLRALLVETYATDSDIAANELSYLKLRLAGHAPKDAKRVAGFVSQRIMAWQKKTNRRLAKLIETGPVAADELNHWLAQVDWPQGRRSTALPTAAARTADSDDEGRGRFYLDKVGRDVGFDSGLQARLLRILNAGEPVEWFQEHPCAVAYRLDGADRIGYPSVGARLCDGRTALIDVQPLGHVAFYVNRVKSAAARAYAHERGWGWLVWTGSRMGVADLLRRTVDTHITDCLRELVGQGPARWPAIRQLRAETGLELLDLAALVLRHEWRWERAPFRLSAGN